jgi:uncharacterized protein
MKLEHAFEVPASPEATFAFLMDAQRVVPCMPGAQLTEVIDDRTWKSRMSVKLGPVGMEFANEVKFLEVDEAARRVRMQAAGRDTRGKGGAQADIESVLAPIDGGTRVELTTDLRFSGQAAQLGRPSVVHDVSQKMVGQFAECLRAQLSASPEAARAAVQEAKKPVSGFALMRAAVSGWFRRLFRRGGSQAKGGSV